MFNDWCKIKDRQSGNKQLCKLREKLGGRVAIKDELIERVRSHYDKLEQIAKNVEDLGFSKASAILKERMPREPQMRSGEIGEIIATEFIEYHTNFRVPIRRLRYKDARDMPLRGDDFLGVNEDDRGRLNLLKGESKSGKRISNSVVSKAREQLSANDGRPTPISLLFLAERLLESEDEGDKSLGQKILNEVAIRAMPPRRITHSLFALSGNAAEGIVDDDLIAADNIHRHISISFRVNDHQCFVKEIFDEAGKLGNS